MRKFFVSVICALCICSAFAAGENVATSKAFVDTAVVLKQDKIPANSGTTQVLTNSGESGTVGTKEIYDSTAAYAGQADSLVEAATMNAAVQNAIDAEFKCVQYNPNDSTDCWLVDIGGAAQSALPSGYTRLEYIESTGTQYIDTGIAPKNTNNLKWKIDVQYINPYGNFNYAGFGVFGGRYWLKFDIKSANVVGIQCGGAYSESQPSVSIANRNIFFMDTESRTFGINNEIQSLSGMEDGALQIPYNIYLFAVSNDQSGMENTLASARLYGAYMANGATAIRNFVPARRNSDGVLGMYDTVSNTFFTNSGTGTFVAGPVFSYLPQN